MPAPEGRGGLEERTPTRLARGWRIYNGVGLVKQFLATPPPPRAGRGVKGAPGQRGVISTLDAAPGTPTIELRRSGVRRTKLRPLKDSRLSRPRLASWNPAVSVFTAS